MKVFCKPMINYLHAAVYIYLCTVIERLFILSYSLLKFFFLFFLLVYTKLYSEEFSVSVFDLEIHELKFEVRWIEKEHSVSAKAVQYSAESCDL